MHSDSEHRTENIQVEKCLLRKLFSKESGPGAKKEGGVGRKRVKGEFVDGKVDSWVNEWESREWGR